MSKAVCENETTTEDEISQLIKNELVNVKDIKKIFYDHVTRCQFFDELKKKNNNLDIEIVYPLIGEIISDIM